MRQSPATLTRGDRRQERLSWTVTLTASAAMHAAVLAVLLQGGPPPPRAGAPTWLFADLTPDGGGGGGEPAVVQLAWGSPASPSTPEELTIPPEIRVPELQLPEITQVPDVELSLAAPETERPAVVAPPPSEAAFAGAGGTPAAGEGQGAGSGTGPGVGAGLGPGGGPGASAPGEGIRPPAPLTILMPPAAIDAVRGGTAKVRLQVDSTGAVRTVDVLVSSGDRGYDEQLRRVASGWRFRPARDAANRPVPYPFEVSVTF